MDDDPDDSSVTLSFGNDTMSVICTGIAPEGGNGTTENPADQTGGLDGCQAGGVGHGQLASVGVGAGCGQMAGVGGAAIGNGSQAYSAGHGYGQMARVEGAAIGKESQAGGAGHGQMAGVNVGAGCGQVAEVGVQQLAMGVRQVVRVVVRWLVWVVPQVAMHVSQVELGVPK